MRPLHPSRPLAASSAEHATATRRRDFPLVTKTGEALCDGRSLLIDEITTLKPSPDYARKELHFLLRSHTQSQLLPAPLPVPDMPDPENPGEKALAANHLFSTFGRFGWFATVADITEKPVVEAAVLKTWLEAHPMKKRVK